MKNELPKRKSNRLKKFDYSSNGAYFVTICTKNKECILGDIVGDGVLDVPKIRLSQYGEIVNERILEMAMVYDNVLLDKYIIMPNHIHLIVKIESEFNLLNGTSRTPSPTNKTLPFFISTLKRLTNRKSGIQLWQRSYYDHIIRNDSDYQAIWEYVNSNTLKWQKDKFYIGD